MGEGEVESNGVGVAYANQSGLNEVGTRLRDIEEKQRLLKDRLLLVGNSTIEKRDRTFKEILELKKQVLILQEEQKTMKSFLQKVGEQLQTAARQEEINTLQRQLDMLRGS